MNFGGCVFLGIGVGNCGSFSDNWNIIGFFSKPQTIKPLLAALSFHQFFEGMGLGGCIAQVSDFFFLFLFLVKKNWVERVTNVTSLLEHDHNSILSTSK